MEKDWRSRIHFCFEDIETPMGRAVDILIVSLVFLVSLIFVIKTYSISPDARLILDGLENLIVAIFVLEYLLRMWSAPKRVRQFFKIYQLIDLVAILPIFFTGQGYQILRVFRALRFLRLVRFMRSQHFFFRRLRPVDIILIRIVYIVLSIIFVSAGMIFYAESSLPGSNINTFFDAVYFSIVTLTTVGFGDIAPVSAYGRFITILIIVSGVVFIPMQIRDLLRHYVSPAVSGGRSDVKCVSCGTRWHETDAKFCRVCGAKL
jgi:voltage-gated potassium channel